MIYALIGYLLVAVVVFAFVMRRNWERAMRYPWRTIGASAACGITWPFVLIAAIVIVAICGATA